jgi:excisionase family DNA binding protein
MRVLKEAVMERSIITRTGTDYLTEDERRKLEDGLKILAKLMTKAVMKEKSLLEMSRSKEYRDSTEPHSKAIQVEQPEGQLTMSVGEAAKILGLSRSTAYEAVDTGEIPSIRIGRRILISRAAINRILS